VTRRLNREGSGPDVNGKHAHIGQSVEYACGMQFASVKTSKTLHKTSCAFINNHESCSEESLYFAVNNF